MFGKKLSLHVIQFPTGRYGYVGSIPKDCCRRLLADKSAIMGQRAVREGDDLVEYRTMTFETEQEAIDYAMERGYEPKLPVKG